MTVERPPLTRAIESIIGKGLFGVFDQRVAERILSLGKEIGLRQGQELFHEGDPGDTAYVVLSGALEVLVDIGNDRVCVAVVEPYKLVGEIAVFANQPRIATVVAQIDSNVLCLERQQWLNLLVEDPGAGQAIIADLGRRLHEVNRPLAFLSTASTLLRNDRVDGESLAVIAQGVGNLGPFAESFSSMVREIRAKQERQQDMAMARRIQDSVLPTALPLDDRELAVHGLIRPMKEVGGDLFDYFMVDETHVAISVADVSGKGVPASLFMMMFHTVLRAVTVGGMGPHLVLSRANALLSANNEECMFVTAVFGLLDLASGELTYVNAGHNPPYLLSGGKCRDLPSDGPAIGILSEVNYQPKTVQMAPGDRLFLFTDGVTEAVAADGSQYGEDRLERILAANRASTVAGMVAAVVRDVDLFAGGREQSDDITCLAVAFRPGA